MDELFKDYYEEQEKRERETRKMKVVKCAAEKVKGMFEVTRNMGDWDGAAKLESTVVMEMSGDDSSKMRFTVFPGDSAASRAFLRVKVK